MRGERPLARFPKRFPFRAEPPRTTVDTDRAPRWRHCRLERGNPPRKPDIPLHDLARVLHRLEHYSPPPKDGEGRRATHPRLYL